jgi:drug/metabolite transporter (DMT)-like permease
MLAIAAGASAYAWGGILTKCRPIGDPFVLAGWQSLVGGGLLLAASLALEPLDHTTLAALLAPVALGNLAFLATGAVIGGAVYLMLLARWSATRVSTYAFICPLIALAEGAALYGEIPGFAELAAACVLLLATGLSLAAQTRTA